ncbi:hypothetical protein [Alteromonas oceanisediminis]|nr:hypothetical protein [Alteromonas oceanisediminis]
MHSIKSVEGYNANGYVQQSTQIVMKAVITGFHGKNDEIIQYQT